MKPPSLLIERDILLAVQGTPWSAAASEARRRFGFARSALELK